MTAFEIGFGKKEIFFWSKKNNNGEILQIHASYTLNREIAFAEGALQQ